MVILYYLKIYVILIPIPTKWSLHIQLKIEPHSVQVFLIQDGHSLIKDELYAHTHRNIPCN